MVAGVTRVSPCIPTFDVAGGTIGRGRRVLSHSQVRWKRVTLAQKVRVPTRARAPPYPAVGPGHAVFRCVNVGERRLCCPTPSSSFLSSVSARCILSADRRHARCARSKPRSAPRTEPRRCRIWLQGEAVSTTLRSASLLPLSGGILFG